MRSFEDVRKQVGRMTEGGKREGGGEGGKGRGGREGGRDRGKEGRRERVEGTRGFERS